MRFHAEASSWAQLIRMQSMPFANNCSTSLGSSAASVGMVTMIRAFRFAGGGPSSASVCCFSSILPSSKPLIGAGAVHSGTGMHVTPATVSIQIRELEKALGVRLFRKAGRGLVLTEMSEAVYRYASEIFAMGRELIDMVRGRPLGQPLLFRVGIKDVMPKVVAYKLIEPTLNMPEQVRLVCREGDFSGLMADLAVHRLDVVLSDTPLDPNLKVRAFSHLLGESEVVILGERKLAQRLKENFPDSLDRAPW